MQADLGFRCLHMTEETFSHYGPIIVYCARALLKVKRTGSGSPKTGTITTEIMQ